MRVPPRIEAMVWQPLQRAHQDWHRSHHGSPVAAEISQSVDRPQIPQVAAVRGRQ
ncbi:hypothetical protein OG298_01940 [Streptomyces sp. NBC_01005]|uniref:hypothetical protein n=1 Tax=unclassified Streptomyces TaxID=2593676 RepID=UPI002E37B6C1|nr:hypothetical protein [Streptomyces sp. NBC_01362]WSW03226.1 hypothetical protein OG298_01940 [Streptomyces sp. NBC_01005]WTC92728.1 hypothetical protein OH736_01925 [Streptomyces sp. NBC_01650]